jgi:predicted O-methyltransferase YrrM
MKTFILLFMGAIIFNQAGIYKVNAADSAAITDEPREEFIRNFKRIGLNTAPDDAMILRILAQTSGAKRGVEVGTATGYGAINMGIAFERNGGHLYTIDIDPQMVKVSKENIKKIGLEKTVTVIEGDALKILPTLEGEFDFVFIDALKRLLRIFKLSQMKKGVLSCG